MGGRGVNAYMFLLCEAWLQNPTGTLPNDEDLLLEFARITRPEWEQFWPVMQHKFVENGGDLLYSVELMNEAQNYELKRFAGKQGWTDERREKQSKRMKKMKREPNSSQ